VRCDNNVKKQLYNLCLTDEPYNHAWAVELLTDRNSIEENLIKQETGRKIMKELLIIKKNTDLIINANDKWEQDRQN
jgi:hypothetical protein